MNLRAKPMEIQWAENYQCQYKRGELKPTYVQWICTYKCNFHCPHCGTAAGDARPDELKTHEILRALSDLSDLGCDIFSVTGGEPLLRYDIFEVLSYAKAKGMKVGIVTNGYATEDYMPQLEKLGLFSVLISIDGYGKNHDEVRGTKGSYERCINSIGLYKKLGVPIVAVSTVMLPDNVKYIPEIIEDVQKMGCTKQRIQPLVPEGRAKGTKNPPEVVKEAFRAVLEARRKGINIEISEGCGYLGPLADAVRNARFFCACGWSTFTIMQDGNVMGCPALDYPELGEGNIRDKSLKEIWRDGFGKFRETVFDDLTQKCKDCEYLQLCRGACWLFRANKADPCFLNEAEEVAAELGITAEPKKTETADCCCENSEDPSDTCSG
ncbi:MAG: radical SAM protein [Elusimicrobiota bacterium]